MPHSPPTALPVGTDSRRCSPCRLPRRGAARRCGCAGGAPVHGAAAAAAATAATRRRSGCRTAGCRRRREAQRTPLPRRGRRRGASAGVTASGSPPTATRKSAPLLRSIDGIRQNQLLSLRQLQKPRQPPSGIPGNHSASRRLRGPPRATIERAGSGEADDKVSFSPWVVAIKKYRKAFQLQMLHYPPWLMPRPGY